MRTNLHSSSLVHFLADHIVSEDVGSSPDLVERMGQWVGVADAIELSAALENIVADQAGKTNPCAFSAMKAKFEGARSALAKSIATNCAPELVHARVPLPDRMPNTEPQILDAYVPYQRYYLARQRDLETSIAPLRESVRQALKGLSPALSRLCELDAVFETALTLQERKSLAKVPLLLEKVFVKQIAVYVEALARSGQDDSPDLWNWSRGWVAEFCKDMQCALLAELDVRLQPILGLVEALDQEVNQEK